MQFLARETNKCLSHFLLCSLHLLCWRKENNNETTSLIVSCVFFSLYSLPCQRKPLIEELDDNLESKEKPLIQELAKKDDLSVRHHSPSRPVIEQINERFTRLNKLSRSLIEEPDTATDFTARGENSKPLIMEIPPEGPLTGQPDQMLTPLNQENRGSAPKPIPSHRSVLLGKRFKNWLNRLDRQ